jgi:mono/diheme cytochrome c family protein
MRRLLPALALLAFLFLLTLLTVLFSSCENATTPAEEGDPPATPALPDAAALDAAVKTMGKALKEELVTALGQSGPTAAISVCQDKAPALAAAHSERTGWTIRRTAPRLRNPDNAPDEWERQQIAAFQQQLADGADPATLTTYEIVDGRARFARGIPTAPECVLCHGSNLEPSLAAAIKATYPDDQATGFQVGELRGIFSVSAEAK